MKTVKLFVRVKVNCNLFWTLCLRIHYCMTEWRNLCCLQPLICWSGCWIWTRTRASRQRAPCRTRISHSTPTRPTSRPANPTTHRSKREILKSPSGEVRDRGYLFVCLYLRDPEFLFPMLGSLPSGVEGSYRWHEDTVMCNSCVLAGVLLLSGANGQEMALGRAGSVTLTFGYDNVVGVRLV